MTPAFKRNLSIAAIVIASVAFGMILTADLGWMKSSHAQQSIQTSQGAVPTVTIPSFASLAERAMPAVVSITTTEVFRESDRRRQQVNPFDFFFPDPRRQQSPDGEDEEHQERSGGSGFFISPDGYIITNNHVVEGATRIEVRYGANDGNTAEAKIIGRDPETDLALIKIETTNAPTLRLGDSNAIRVGDWAIAIGNPLQFENTLTVGVISAKDRALGISETTRSFENFIQTDAAINFGNSGGPLLNINGEVVGINTAIRGGGAQNIGFATPVNIAKQILPQLREKGRVVRGYLGIRVGDVTAEQKEAFSLPAVSGAFVQSVEEGKPAEKAGIRHGDVVVRVDDVEVRRTRDLIDYVSSKAPGTNVNVTIIRDGQRRTVTARVAERPGEESAEDDDTSNGEAPARDRIGISIQELTPSIARQYGIDEDEEGVVITRVKEVSPAGDAGLAAGDVITEANGQKITSANQFRDIVQAARPGSYLRLYATRFARGGGRSQSFFAIVKVP